MRTIETRAYLVLGLLGVAGMVSSQDPSEVESILRRVSQTYQALEKYHFEAETVSELISERFEIRTRTHIVIAAEGPDKMRVQISGPNTNLDMQLVSDGETVWEYLGAERKVSRKQLKEVPYGVNLYFRTWVAALGVRVPDYSTIDRGVREAKLLGEQQIETHTGKADCYLVRADYSSDPYSPSRESWSKTFWVDKQRWIVLKELSVASLESGPTSAAALRRFTAVFTVAKINEDLPEALFRFSPPARAR